MFTPEYFPTIPFPLSDFPIRLPKRGLKLPICLLFPSHTRVLYRSCQFEHSPPGDSFFLLNKAESPVDKHMNSRVALSFLSVQAPGNQ